MNKVSSELVLGQKKKELKRIQPMLKIRSPISANIKRSKDSKLIANGLENLESLSLYSIKLGLVRDLISLSSKYQSTSSVQARFSKILNLSQSLNSLLRISEERLRTDIKFRDKLINDLNSIESVQVLTKALKPEVQNQEESFKICVNVSGVLCIAFITHNRSFSQFDIDVYGQIEPSYYSYHLNQTIKATKTEFEGVLRACILDHMYFDILQGRIVLRFKEKFDNEEALVLNVQGIGHKACVVLKEIQSLFEIQVEGKAIRLEKTEIRIGSIKELRYPGKRNMVRMILEQNLSLVHRELCWKLSQWEISRATEKKTHIDLFKREFLDRRDKLESFESVLVSGTVFLKGSNIRIDLVLDSFLQKSRVLLYLSDISIKIREEDYTRAFKSLKKLQKVEICSVTMLRSLEFLQFINGLFFD